MAASSARDSSVASRKRSAPAPKVSAASAASAPKRVEPLNAKRARQFADLAVTVVGELAQFGHVAEHQPAPAGQLAQHLERGACRTGIGVVGIIDEPGAAGACACNCSRPLTARIAGQAGGHLAERRARADGGGRRGQRIAARCAGRRAPASPATVPDGLRRRKRVAKPCVVDLEAQLTGAKVSLLTAVRR